MKIRHPMTLRHPVGTIFALLGGTLYNSYRADFREIASEIGSKVSPTIVVLYGVDAQGALSS